MNATTNAPTYPVEPLLTVRDAARALAVSPRTIWTLTDRGLLPCIRINRSVRYSPRDVAALVDRQRVSA